MYVIFENTGEIDIRAITTFGVSAKETNNPIGYFGTGLKYAIAITLRNDCELKIMSGETILDFAIKDIEMRNSKFQVVTMGGADLPFTTELGKNWEMWQAFREIYCNCLDEYGSVYESEELPSPVKGRTCIVVKSDEFYNFFKRRGDIVLDIKELLIHRSDYAEIYNTPSEYVFYRGVRVAKLDQKSMFTYNILSEMSLTEDRTLQYSWEPTGIISRLISTLDDSTKINQILNADKNSMENKLEYGHIKREKISNEFYECLQKAYFRNSDKTNKSALRWFIKHLNESSIKNYKKAKLKPVEQQQLDKCINICADLYPTFRDYNIKVVENLGESTMAIADEKMMTMIISQRCFTLGTKFLLSTLIEEFFHLSTGFADCTRELQTYLFDNISTLIENYVVQEPI